MRPDIFGAEAEVTGSDDCLKINIWKPPNAKKGDGLSVMVFIHGGGFNEGGIRTNDPYGGIDGGVYQGQNLVDGTVVVTIQYRLGIFGFGASDKLRGLNELGSTGNYGINDQRLALQWVQQHIENFGGHPESVMIFGESAGAESVSAHAISELSWPYFHRGAMESGSFSRQLMIGFGDAQAQFDQVANALCPYVVDDTDKLVDCLSVAPVLDLLTAPGADVRGLIYDGVIIKHTYDEALQSTPPHVKDVPYILGSTAGDGTIAAMFGGAVQGYEPFGITTRKNLDNITCVGGNLDTPYTVTTDNGHENQALSLLDVFGFDQLDPITPSRKVDEKLNEWYWTSSAIIGGMMFKCPSVDAAQDLSSSPDFTSDVFVYEYMADHDAGEPNTFLFDIDADNHSARPVLGSGGSGHGSELISVFSVSQLAAEDMLTLDVHGYIAPAGQNAPREKIDALAKKMSSAWINFAKSGKPGFGWDSWDNANPTKASFDFNLKDEDMRKSAHKATVQCAVLDQAWYDGKCGPFVEY